jgi:ferredoxin
MADPTDKLPGQAPGKYYVDGNCIDCDVCRCTAPNNFEANEDEGYSFVVKQPENDEEEAQCQEAMESCPVEAIGDDGDELQQRGDSVELRDGPEQPLPHTA